MVDRKTFSWLKAHEDQLMACVRLPYWRGPGPEPLWHGVVNWLHFAAVTGLSLGAVFGSIFLCRWSVVAAVLGLAFSVFVFARFVNALDRANAADMAGLGLASTPPRAATTPSRAVPGPASIRAGSSFALTPRRGRAHCAYCRTEFAGHAPSCPGCATLLHSECRLEAGGCTSLGCTLAAPRLRS